MGKEDGADEQVGMESEVSSSLKIRNRKHGRALYPSWSEGARRIDEEMQKELETHDERRLASIVSGLGFYEFNEVEWQEKPELFVKGPKCLQKLKELQRCLTRDNPDRRRVFMQLGRWSIVRKHLVPIILRYPEDRSLFITALKVAVILTVPVDSTSQNTSDQVDILSQLKNESLHYNVLGAILAHLEEPLENMEKGCLDEDDWRLLQLVLALFGNLLNIPESCSSATGPYPIRQYSAIRDGILECMFKECATDILLAITRHLPYQNTIRKGNLLIIQILHHMFWGQKPDALFAAKTGNKTYQQSESKRESVKKPSTSGLSRHTNFCGTFVRMEKDGTKTMITRNPFRTTEDKMKQNDEASGVREKPVAHDVDIPLPSQERICVLLKQYADEFLTTGAYNALMQSLKDDIRRERKDVTASDVITFFQVATFFTSYQHYHLSKNQIGEATEELSPVDEHFCSHISSTMDEAMFTVLLSKWSEYQEYSKSAGEWKSIVAAGGLIVELVRILEMVLKSSKQDDQRDKRMARVLLYKILYDQTENGILYCTHKAIREFNIYKQPKSHLTNMVAITHLMLRLTEHITEEDGALRVVKKARKIKRKRKQTRDDDNAEHAASEENISGNCENEQTEQGVTEAEQAVETTEQPVENEQQAKALETEQQADEPEQPVENELQGEALETEQQADTNEHSVENQQANDTEQAVGTEQTATPEVSAKAADEENEEDEDDDEGDTLNETNFDLQKCVQRFADTAIISKYCWLLTFYDTNSPAMNDYIACMLQRICNDCMLEPMLYQVSILDKFHRILSDKRMTESDENSSLISFITKFVRGFFKALKSNSLLYADVLFPKNRRESHEIGADYMIRKLKGEASCPGARKNRIADSLGDDEGGTFEQVTAEKLSSLRQNAEQKKKRSRRGPFSEEDEIRIQELFEQFKEKRSCAKLIAEALGEFSAAQVSRKLKKLGLQRTPNSKKMKSLEQASISPFNKEDEEEEEEESDKETLSKMFTSDGSHSSGDDDDQQPQQHQMHEENLDMEVTTQEEHNQQQQQQPSSRLEDEEVGGDDRAMGLVAVLPRKRKLTKQRDNAVDLGDMDLQINAEDEAQQQHRKVFRIDDDDDE